MDEWCGRSGAEAFAQISDVGSEGYRPKNMAWSSFLGPDDWDERFAAADVVVAHAGMGTIISALMAGKPIVIMPRSVAYNEHRNEHQVATAKRFEGRPGVHVAMDEFQLPKLVEVAVSQPPVGVQRLGRYADQSLIETIRDFIISTQ